MTDWLDEGLPGRTAKTVEANRDPLRPLLAVIGTIPLKHLTVQDVRTALKKTTEVIYRRELRPVITTGAEVMDQIFRPEQRQGTAASAAK